MGMLLRSLMIMNSITRVYGRDEKILLHIWRWKLATPASIHQIFFKQYHFQNSLYFMNKLKNKKLVQAVSNLSGKSMAWALTRKGFKSLSSLLPSLKEAGYKSDCPRHDILLSSIQYEGFLSKDMDYLSIITEQELRRYKREILPKWVPNIEFRRPDGYWRVKSKKTSKEDIFALEVELSRKTDSDYQSISGVYAREKSVRRVMWFVPDDRQVKRLNTILNTQQKKSYSKHNIIRIDDYHKDLWRANISAGPEEGIPMGKLLGFVPVETLLKAKYSPMLDGRRYPAKTKGYKIYGEY